MTWRELYKIDVVTTNREAFGNKVIEVAGRLNLNPNWLMGLMYFETARTMSHTITNGLGCVGLIQFCSPARTDLKVTANQLRAMTNVQQMEYVYKYFNLPFQKSLLSKVRHVTDLYLIIFYPISVGKPNDYVIGSHNGAYRTIYNNNPAFQDGTGKIKVQNVIDKINSFLTGMPTGTPTPPVPGTNPPDVPYDGGLLPETTVTASRIVKDNGIGTLIGIGILALGIAALTQRNKRKTPPIIVEQEQEEFKTFEYV